MIAIAAIPCIEAKIPEITDGNFTGHKVFGVEGTGAGAGAVSAPGVIIGPDAVLGPSAVLAGVIGIVGVIIGG